MIKLSTLLLDAAREAATMALERDVTECPIPGLEKSYLVSRSEVVPDGYEELGTTEVDRITFRIYQQL